MSYGYPKGKAKPEKREGVKKATGNWGGHPSTHNPLPGNKGHKKGKKY